jgi:membrane protein
MLASFWSLLRQTFYEWSEDGAPRLGAALAYYSVFSIGPLLLIAISVASLVFEGGAVQREVVNQITKLVGQQGAEAVQAILANVSIGSQSTIGTVLGIGVLLFGAVAVVVQLKDALNIIWDIEPDGSGIWYYVRTYGLSLAAVLGLGFMLAVSLFTTTLISTAGTLWGSGLPQSVMAAINFIADLAVLTLLFALMFKLLPDTEVAWSDVWLGAAFTTFLFIGGKFAIAFYLGRQGLESTFGAASSIVLILVWIYYSAQIVFFGAEFTQVYARTHGSRAAETHGHRDTSGELTKSEAVDAHIKQNLPYLAYVAIAGTVGLAVGALMMRKSNGQGSPADERNRLFSRQSQRNY